MSKRLLSLLLAVVMVLSFSLPVLAENDIMLISENPASKDIVILHTNDVHGEYKKNIGYAGLAAYKAEMVKDNYVTLVDAGDFSQGASIAILSKGEYLIDIMNEVGYDIVVPGNHEFDYGIAQALKNLEDLDATVVSCNFVDLVADKPVYDAYKIITYGDVDVAYVGISTPETYTKSTPTYFMNAAGEYIYGFSEGEGFYATVQASVDAAVAAGAEYVVAVGHCGTDSGSSPWTSEEIIANTTGIDAFIDGHSHTTIENKAVANKDGENVVLAQTGDKLNAIGKLTIKADGTIAAELVTDYAAKDATVEAFVKTIEANFTEYTSQVVAKSNVDLIAKNPDGSWAVRDGETNMGDLIADAYRIEQGTDIGIMNGGGIRDNIAAGDVTIADILAVMTFGNMATAVEVTGQQIKDCLEMGASSYPDRSGGFTHVSGMSYTIDATVKSSVVKDEKGNFSSVTGAYRVKDIMVGGEPLDLAKTYTVACHSYWLTQYGDGMTMFTGAKVIEEKHEKIVDNVLLVNYIQEELKGVIGEEYAAPQGRITLITSPFSDVVSAHWYFDAVKYCYEENLIKGLPGGVFGAQQTMNIGQYLTILYRMGVEMAPGVYEEKATTDANWLEAARYLGALSGDEYTDAELMTPITREQIAYLTATFVDGLVQNLGGTVVVDPARTAVFTDEAAITAEYKEAVQWFYAVGGIDGYPDGSYQPTKIATRAEVAKILSNMENIQFVLPVAAPVAAD